MVSGVTSLYPYGTRPADAACSVSHAVLLRRIRRREKPLRFEIMRLDDVDGSAVDSTVVDAASVNRIVQQAASTGQRIYIRPATSAAQ